MKISTLTIKSLPPAETSMLRLVELHICLINLHSCTDYSLQSNSDIDLEDQEAYTPECHFQFCEPKQVLCGRILGIRTWTTQPRELCKCEVVDITVGPQIANWSGPALIARRLHDTSPASSTAPTFTDYLFLTPSSTICSAP
jgi:hypothetical protein